MTINKEELKEEIKEELLEELSSSTSCVNWDEVGPWALRILLTIGAVVAGVMGDKEIATGFGAAIVATFFWL